jgi:hypothetical protein
VVGHDAARLLAQRGAHLVHSAPSTGVRDWSDLRIAVAAGIWLAAARPGDLIEIVSDDRAFDAVGDVSASLGIAFRRLSYRRLVTDEPAAAPVAERPASGDASGSRRRRRRRGRGPAPAHAASGGQARHAESRDVGRHAAPTGASASRAGGGRGRGPSTHGHRPAPPTETPHTAPHDELVSVVRGLVEGSPRRSVVIDAVANALKARGFQRPPGSPRLVTRLRRIRELIVSPSGTITLADVAGPPRHAPESQSAPEDEVGLAAEPQPDQLGDPDDDSEPEVDGNRRLPEIDEDDQPPEVDGNRATQLGGNRPPPPGQGRRRRRRRRRGGQRRPAPGPQST